MMTQHDRSTTDYIRRLKAALIGLPREARDSIIDDVKAHIDDAQDSGRDAAETLTALGTPQQVADAARAELGVQASAPPAESAARTLHAAAIVLAVITAVFVSFLLPAYAIEQSGSEQTGSVLQTATSLFDRHGLGIALLPLIPALIAALPLMTKPPLRTAAGWAVAGAMSVLSAVAGFSIGGFFLPLTLLLWTAVLLPLWARRGASPALERTARIIAAVVIASPMLFGVATALIGAFRDPMLPFWIAAAVMIVIAVTFALRVRFADPVVAVVGFGIMMLALFDAGVLTMAVWWIGAAWLVAGVCGMVARRVRSS